MIEQNILELANKLGDAMAEAARTKAFKQARTAAMADKDTQAILQAYQKHLNLLARKEHEGKPIEVEDKRALTGFQEKIYRSDKLKALMEAQANYVEMIQQVNDLIGGHLITPEEIEKEKTT